MTTVFRESIHKSGDYFEVDIFPYKHFIAGRSQKLRLSSECQQNLNHRNCIRRLTWIMQENFTKKDVFTTLTYPAGEYISLDRAERNFKNWLRRVRYAANKSGLEFKYISTTEKGEMCGRVHHHVVCSGGLGRDFLEQQWKNKTHGIAQTRYIEFYADGLESLANYICKDNTLSYRSYNCSKNLKRPEPEKNDGRITAQQLQKLRSDTKNAEAFEALYPGYTFVSADPFYNEYYINANGAINSVFLPYITIKMYKKGSKYIDPRFRNVHRACHIKSPRACHSPHS